MPYSPNDDMPDDEGSAAEAAVEKALGDLLRAERTRMRLSILLRDGETHRPGMRTDLLADIGAVRREVEVARRNLDFAHSALVGGETVERILACPASAETSMAARLGNNLSVAAIEAHVVRPSALLPKTASPASA
ncbi:hypothetical protein ACLBYG_22065 [Methylobacterium sp. D53M]